MRDIKCEIDWNKEKIMSDNKENELNVESKLRKRLDKISFHKQTNNISLVSEM
ncbi:hypothetical protein LCGC14_1961960 [marine sediment metagenome]|uniref:Uncharacterized protein n=1 Tax=marine sediment metagenome TaxID=412755 RepID=A0A0F9IBF3_9ZZZZ